MNDLSLNNESYDIGEHGTTNNGFLSHSSKGAFTFSLTPFPFEHPSFQVEVNARWFFTIYTNTPHHNYINDQKNNIENPKDHLCIFTLATRILNLESSAPDHYRYQIVLTLTDHAPVSEYRYKTKKNTFKRFHTWWRCFYLFVDNPVASLPKPRVPVNDRPSTEV